MLLLCACLQVLFDAHSAVAEAIQRACVRLVAQAFDADWALVHRDLPIRAKSLQDQVQRQLAQASGTGSQLVLSTPDYLHKLKQQATCAAFTIAGALRQLQLLSSQPAQPAASAAAAAGTAAAGGAATTAPDASSDLADASPEQQALVKQAGAVLKQFLAARGFWAKPEEASVTLQQQLQALVTACVLPEDSLHAALAALQAHSSVSTLGQAAAAPRKAMKQAAKALQLPQELSGCSTALLLRLNLHLLAVLFGSTRSISSIKPAAQAAAGGAGPGSAASSSRAAASQGGTDSATIKQAWSGDQLRLLQRVFVDSSLAPAQEQVLLQDVPADQAFDYTSAISSAWHHQVDNHYLSLAAAATGFDTPDFTGAVVRVYDDLAIQLAPHKRALAHGTGPGSAPGKHTLQLLPASLLPEHKSNGRHSRDGQDGSDDAAAAPAAQTAELSTDEVLWRVLPSQVLGRASGSRSKLLRLTSGMKAKVAGARTLQELRWGVELLLAEQQATGRKLPTFDEAWRVFTVELGKQTNRDEAK
jgi:hypothetical protein